MKGMRPITVLAAWAAALVLLLTAPRADAYAWMVRHEYVGCNQCHADPSGGGLLTAYGRAQGELLLRSRYGSSEEEPGPQAGFLFGAVNLPESVLLGGGFRALRMWTFSRGESRAENLWMQSDLQGQVSFDRVRVNASIGYVHEGAQAAAITHNATDNLVSRTHWVGVDLGADREWLLRAGRMNLPFGIRFLEHTLRVRRTTRTSINDHQQHGLALAYNGGRVRGEIMGVLGNFQMHPDMYRSRGAVGYVEFAPLDRLALGVSALALHADRDLDLSSAAWRQAYALSIRYVPARPVVLLGEGDVLVQSASNGRGDTGYAGVLQADWEIVQGVHALVAAELENTAPSSNSTTYVVWGSANWFFAPHTDARVDLTQQSIGAGSERVDATAILAQLHLFL